jgi:hypothetical protein
MKSMSMVAGDDGGGSLEVDICAHAFEFGAHRRDVVVGPFRRMDIVFARRVFGGKSERVPAHRMQHVETARALVARHDVAERVIAHVAHMDAARRIRKHLKHVIFRARGIGAHAERRALFPGLLPAGFRLIEIISSHDGFLTARGGCRNAKRAFFCYARTLRMRRSRKATWRRKQNYCPEEV